MFRSGVWLCTAVSDVAVPRKLSSTMPTIQLTSPAAEENPNCGFVLHPSVVTARTASRPASRVVSTRTRLKTYNARSARSLSTARARSEEHTSELQSPCNLVCRLLLEKKKEKQHIRADLN